MSRKFNPLVGDLGLPVEIRCRNCGKLVPDIDTETEECQDCFSDRPQGMKARWIGLTWLVITAYCVAVYYLIYKLITIL